MSKSDPNSAIFMEDSEMEVNSKIKKAYCPPEVRRPAHFEQRAGQRGAPAWHGVVQAVALMPR